MAKSIQNVQKAATVGVQVFTQLNQAIRRMEGFVRWWDQNKLGNVSGTLQNLDGDGNISGTGVSFDEVKKAIAMAKDVKNLLDGLAVTPNKVYRDDLEAISEPF